MITDRILLLFDVIPNVLPVMDPCASELKEIMFLFTDVGGLVIKVGGLSAAFSLCLFMGFV